ncbi:MAG: hypothetical protein ACI8Q1_001019 [Parvicella sp.]
MKIYIYIALLFYSSISFGQLIDNSDCKAFTDVPFFDTMFVRQNGVKSIKGHVSTKKDLKVIKSSNQMTSYNFDRSGRLETQLGTFNTSGIKDSNYLSYEYDERNNLILQRTSDSYGFFSYKYTYDDSNRVTSKTYCREESSGTDRFHFELGKQFTIVKESYKYIDSDSIVNKSVYNNHDRIYQKYTYHYSDLDLLTAIKSQYIISKKQTETTFKYNDLSQVVHMKFVKNLKNPDEVQVTKFQYDELGNLTYIDEYKGINHVTHKEVLYDRSNYLLKALLVQDVATNHITIIKFTTVFYEN